MPQTREDKLRGYTGGRFALELDDHQQVGWVTAVDGGHLKSTAITSMVGQDAWVTKYAGKATYEDVSITLGAAMSPQLWKWVRASIERRPERRNGALVAYDFNQRERSRRTFYDALISEIAFPALDATAKNAGTLTLKISPERVVYEPSSKNGPINQPGYANKEPIQQKKWLSNNFSFSLDRFKGDEALHHAKIEAFTIKQNIIQNPVGNEKVARKEAGRLELPQLVVTLPENLADGWVKWFQTAVAEGDRMGQYTTGSIRFFGQPMKKDELMRFDLHVVSLVSLEFDKWEAQKEGLEQVKATLNVESMHMVPGDGTVGSTR
jgi:phage tail-like protein